MPHSTLRPAQRPERGSLGSSGQRGAWLAADGRVAALVERQQRNRELFARVPHIARGPRGERRQLEHLLAAGQREQRRLFERGAAPCLLAAQAGEPHAIAGDGFEERLDLAQLAAAVGRGLIEQPMLRFLLGDSLLRKQIDEVQIATRARSGRDTRKFPRSDSRCREREPGSPDRIRGRAWSAARLRPESCKSGTRRRVPVDFAGQQCSRTRVKLGFTSAAISSVLIDKPALLCGDEDACACEQLMNGGDGLHPDRRHRRRLLRRQRSRGQRCFAFERVTRSGGGQMVESATGSSSRAWSRKRISSASMRQVTAPAANRERSMAIDDLRGSAEIKNAAAMAPARFALAGGHRPQARQLSLRSPAGCLDAAVTMPAATVAFVSGSMRMNAPVVRFSRVAIECDRPQQVERDRRRCRSSAVFRRVRARACRDRCGDRWRNECRNSLAGVLEQVAPIEFERPLIHPHQRGLAAARDGALALRAATIKSPRLISSSRSSTRVTESGAMASSRSPSHVTMRVDLCACGRREAQ